MNRRTRETLSEKNQNRDATSHYPSQKTTVKWKRAEPNKRTLILQMAAMGQSMRKIASIMTLNVSTVSRIIRRETVGRMATTRLGRPRITQTGSNQRTSCSNTSTSLSRSGRSGTNAKESSLEQRSAIVALHREGISTRQIAKRMCVSQTMVVRCLKRFKENRCNKNRVRCGRPRITTEREDKYITVLSKRERTRTAPDIREELNALRSSSLSVPTVRRRLLEVGLKGRIAAKKPLLREANKIKRLQWAKDHEHWNINQWSKVLFTDESKFDLFSSKRRVFVRRLPGERMNQGCVVPTVKHGGGSVLVWGSFARSGVGDLIRIEGILKKEGYLDILKQNAVPNGLQLIGKGFTFQQDNDPKHSAKLCRGYVQDLDENGTLSNMVWPAQSPDLNPIELLWDELDRNTRQMRPQNHKHLWECLQTAWKQITSDTLKKLIERMPRICKAVIKANGGYFEESKV